MNQIRVYKILHVDYFSLVLRWAYKHYGKEKQKTSSCVTCTDNTNNNKKF